MITVALSRELGSFEGPLDLLLALVRRNQYPPDALPLAEITRQYLSYIQVARKPTSRSALTLRDRFLTRAAQEPVAPAPGS